MRAPHDIDLKSIAWHAMGKYGFEARFSPAVIDEVNRIQEKTFSPSSDMRDLRSLLWSSIDNFDSLDLDQLEYCERGESGEIRVKVAIADVDIYVPKQSETDRHAAHNGTSVYTGIETFPMLPDRLSHDITSLVAGHERMAVVIEYVVLPNGDVRHGDLYRALVANKAKLVYEEIGDWLEGINPVPLSVECVPGLREQILMQNEASQRMRKFRVDQGALVLNTVEAQPVVEGDAVRDLVVQKQNLARSVIEEFMVAANQTMVDYLGKAVTPMIQRVVRVPKNWDGIVMTAALYHETLPVKPDAKALSRFLARQKERDPERFPDLSLTIVKLLGPGEYMALEPDKPPYGHFALAISDYTHATAPNRRYVDVINQRLVKSVFDRKKSPYSLQDLVDLSAWLTDREKAGKKVKRFMRKAAAAVLLHDRIGKTFDALVTGASPKGTYLRLLAPPAEGRIIRGEHGLVVGQKVRARLLKTDPYNGFIDFECTDREEFGAGQNHHRWSNSPRKGRRR
jgi:exoribonuclease-2